MIEEIQRETETLFERLEKTFGVRLGGTFVALTRKSDGGFERAGAFTITRDGEPPDAQGAPVAAPTPPPPGTKVKFGADGKVYPASGGDATHYIVPTLGELTGDQYVEGADLERIRTARESGYTGNICVGCGNAKMRRNGTCEMCEVCGATSGCS